MATVRHATKVRNHDFKLPPDYIVPLESPSPEPAPHIKQERVGRPASPQRSLTPEFKAKREPGLPPSPPSASPSPRVKMEKPDREAQPAASSSHHNQIDTSPRGLAASSSQDRHPARPSATRASPLTRPSARAPSQQQPASQQLAAEDDKFLVRIFPPQGAPADQKPTRFKVKGSFLVSKLLFTACRKFGLLTPDGCVLPEILRHLNMLADWGVAVVFQLTL